MKKKPKYLYQTTHGEGVTYSQEKGNFWGKIISYSLNRQPNSKRVKTSTIKERIYINKFGYIN